MEFSQQLPARAFAGFRSSRCKSISPPVRRVSGPRPRGLSLLELTAALAITATLGAACMSLLSTVQASWLQHRQELAIREEALSALAHIVRNVRQAAAVAEIAPDKLRLLVADGPDSIVEKSWSYDAALKQIVYEDAAGSEVLAEGIGSFSIEARRHDSAIPADPSEVRVIACHIGYHIPAPQGTIGDSVSGWVCLRSW